MTVAKERMGDFGDHNFPYSMVKFFKKKKKEAPIYLTGVVKSDKAVFGLSGVVSGVSVFSAFITNSGERVYAMSEVSGSVVDKVYCCGGAS